MSVLSEVLLAWGIFGVLWGVWGGIRVMLGFVVCDVIMPREWTTVLWNVVSFGEGPLLGPLGGRGRP